MINIMQQHTIITLKNEGKSNREVARQMGVSRKTVSRYWNDYLEQLTLLAMGGDTRGIQENITKGPSYDSSKRKPIKYTTEIDKLLDEILVAEEVKRRELGPNNKQMLTTTEIHKMIVEADHDIGVSTIRSYIRKKREQAREAFIRQEYDLASRLEYDFGEVSLIIDGIKGTYHMAVFGAPASKFRWAYLYDNQKKEVFLDSHVRFFAMVGGIWREVVYDNMKNVVYRFIGRSDKELNGDLVKMSIYYGFSVNVTNCFAGNEKGFVESSVKEVRKEAFTRQYRFDSLEDAQAHLHEVLARANETSRIKEERELLLPARPPLELASISEHTVDKYSFIRVDNNFYSVPDYLVGKKLVVKSYSTEIIAYSALEKVCSHKRLKGKGQLRVDILHYLDTLMRKPGALSNAAALKCERELKVIYDDHFQDDPRSFIQLLIDNKHKTIPEIVIALEAAVKDTTAFTSSPSLIARNVLTSTRRSLASISEVIIRGGARHAS
ncbi:MAG: IS21 family transposase [Coriobacteriia bacterium]|nr:IS21 family transposase [Coriobacteriia bacterium]